MSEPRIHTPNPSHEAHADTRLRAATQHFGVQAREGNAVAQLTEEQVKELRALRIEEIHAGIDELAILKDRMKCSAGPKCGCGGKGYINVVIEPVLRASKVAPSGAVKVGAKFRLIPCLHNDFEAREKNRLYQENVSSSRIGLEVLRQLSVVSNQLAEDRKFFAEQISWTFVHTQWGAVRYWAERIAEWGVRIGKWFALWWVGSAKRVGGVPPAGQEETREEKGPLA